MAQKIERHNAPNVIEGLFSSTITDSWLDNSAQICHTWTNGRFTIWETIVLILRR